MVAEHVRNAALPPPLESRILPDSTTILSMSIETPLELDCPVPAGSIPRDISQNKRGASDTGSNTWSIAEKPVDIVPDAVLDMASLRT